MQRRVHPLPLKQGAAHSSTAALAHFACILVPLTVVFVLLATLHLHHDTASPPSSPLAAAVPPPPPESPAVASISADVASADLIGLTPAAFVLFVVAAALIVCLVLCCLCFAADRAHRSRVRVHVRTPDLERSNGLGFDDLDKDGSDGSITLPAPPSPVRNQPPSASSSASLPLQLPPEYDHTDSVLRVFNWYKTAPAPLAIPAVHVPQALLSLGVHVSSADLDGALSRYLSVSARPDRLELAEFRSLVAQCRPLDEAERTFRVVDRDLSGDIDASELHVALRMLGLDATSVQARRLLAKFDANRSSRLGLDEFRTLCAELRRYRASSFDEIALAFRRFDRDGSGDIDAHELQPALLHLGLPTDDSEARRVLEAFDADGSGRMELDEFRTLVAQLRHFHSERRSAARRAFAQHDRDSDGRVDRRELRAALLEIGLAADSPASTAILATREPSTHFDLGEFESLVDELRAALSRPGHEASTHQHQSTALAAPAILALPLAERAAEAPQVAGDVGAASVDEGLVRRVFTAFDRDSNAKIDGTELRGALNALGLQTNNQQAAAVLQRFDADANSTLDLDEFQSLVVSVRGFQDRQLARPPTDVPAADGIDEVREAFVRFDSNGDGRMDASELDACLYTLGLPTTSDEAQQVLERYDIDRSGALELAEFRRLVDALRAFGAGERRPRAQAAPAALTVEVARSEPLPPARYPSEIGTETEAEIGATSDLPLPAAPMEGVEIVFARYDKDRSGDMDVIELKQALRALNMPVDTAEADQVLNAFDVDSSKRLELHEFRTLVERLRAFQQQGDSGEAGKAGD